MATWGTEMEQTEVVRAAESAQSALTQRGARHEVPQDGAARQGSAAHKYDRTEQFALVYPGDDRNVAGSETTPDSFDGRDASAVSRRFAPGTAVFDSRGDKLGTLARIDSLDDGLILQRGLLFRQRVAVPMDVIDRRGPDDGVYLTVSKDDVNGGNWGAADSGASVDSSR